MKNNNTAEWRELPNAKTLRSITGDLTDVHDLLSSLCAELSGGGLVHARDLRPVLAGAVPRLQAARDAMEELSASKLAGSSRTSDSNGANPLLM